MPSQALDNSLLVSQARHSHIDIISLHDAAEVLVGGEDPVEAVVVDVSYNHLRDKRRRLLVMKAD